MRTVTELVLSRRTHRYVDAFSKLLGVGLLAGGLELGITSAPGAALALLGTLLGVITVFLTENTQ